MTPHSRTVRVVTAGNLLCTGSTCGNGAAFNFLDWSAPASPDVTTFTIGGTASNHSSGHIEIVADGYDRVQVLNALYRFNVRFKGDDNEAQDFVFAYHFDNSATAIFTHTAGTVGIDNWKDLRQSRGWVFKRMSATHSGGSVHPSASQVEVRIPNVYSIAKKMNLSVTTQSWEDYTHTILPTATGCVINAFLHIIIMTIDGVALSAGDVQIDVDVFQKIKVWKSIAELSIEPADQED